MAEFKIDGNLGIGELSPGSTGRRWQPEGGMRKHKERIDRDSRYADHNMNLPFTFSKPRRPGRKHYMKCPKCDSIVYVSVNTIGIICNNCNSYVNLEEVQMSEE
jgi:hypothetical protein